MVQRQGDPSARRIAFGGTIAGVSSRGVDLGWRYAPRVTGPTPSAAQSVASSAGGLPLPPFDVHGNLPAGSIVGGVPRNPILYTTLVDIRQQLVNDFPRSTKRPLIWNGWMRHRGEIETLNIPYATLVNGSFVTNKANPADIDLCYLFDAVDVNAIALTDQPRFRALFDPPACKATYLCDPYQILCYPMVHLRFQVMLRDVAYWTRALGTDRKGRIKCILMVGERGTL